MTAQRHITDLTTRIQSEFGFTIHVCAEVEYVFAYDDGAVPDSFWQALLDAAQAAQIPLDSIGRESVEQAGLHQYECRFAHTDPSQAACALNWLNAEMARRGQEVGLLSFEQACERGIYCGLHWHLHLLDSDGNYCFFKRAEEMSEPLRFCLGGLLETMPALMPYFAPHEASYLRLGSGADHIPQTQSWGGNNRSCALRLPESVVPHRHIEHRVCGADADPQASLWAILVGIHYGLTRRCDPGAQCYGDANRSPLPRLPRAPKQVPQADWLAEYQPARTPSASA